VLDDAVHGPQDHLGTAVFTAAGSYNCEVLYFNSTGGAELEFYAASGAKTTWDATMKLVGDTANGGLAVVTTLDAATNGGLIGTNVAGSMLGVRGTVYARMPFTYTPGSRLDAISLDVSYNDGFVAYLNGVEIARRNAPTPVNWQSLATTTRANSVSIVPERIDVSAFRDQFVPGANVLAVQGLNRTAADASFLLLPELKGTGLFSRAQAYYFTQPTPKAANSSASIVGFLADTQFSVKRGIYDAPFTVNITCATPGATIIYTTDGSEPSASNGVAVLPASPAATGLASVLINKTTVLRALAAQAGYVSTNVDTNTYLFLSTVLAQPSSPAGWPAPGTAINGQKLDYAMDPNIVNNTNTGIGGNTAVRNALLALPSVCLSLPVASLTNSATGIYVNPGQDGFDWERKATIEMLNDPNTLDHGFHARCGLRIRGGYSRTGDNPKHGLRIFFRSDYGDSKLNYPIYAGDDKAADTFDKFDLNCSQNYSWAFGGPEQNLFIRDQLCNDMQLGMGSLSQHNRYVHLFLNGLYWGVYGIQERPEAAFAASYLGGSATDYDVIKTEAGPYTINPTDGDLNAWRDLWNKSRACYFINKDQNSNGTAHPYTLAEKNAAYFKLMGLAADGVTPTADPILLNEKELIDYMMLIFFSGNSDAPLSGFLGNNSPNNFYALRDRRGGKGFFFVAHDSEHTFEASGANGDRTGPFNDPVSGSWTNFNVSNPQFTHQDLMLNKEYQMRFADRAYKHLVDARGALTVAANQARLAKRGAELEPAMVAESARWGDTRITPAKTIVDWRNTKTALNTALASRNAALLTQLKADNLYSSIDPPTLSPLSGTYPSTLVLGISGPAGTTALFTVDGPDPRQVGGAQDPAAQTSATATEVVSVGEVWKFLDDGSDQGTAWKEPAFDENLWTQIVDGVPVIKSGPSRLGYGEVASLADATTVGYVDTDPITAGTQRNITTYFRRSFEIANLAPVVGVSLEVARDDGCVVYLNGKELGRSNMPAPPAVISYTTTASGSVDSAGAAVWQTIPIAISDLQQGTNVLAVEIHQFFNGSNDIGFNLRLRTTLLTAGAPNVLTAGFHTVRSRSRDINGNWSALNEQTYLIGGEAASSANLIVKEMMYHPTNPTPAEVAAGFTSDNDFQWLELKNVGSKLIDLRGAYFAAGITFTFPESGPVKTLAPGARTLLVANLPAFQSRYGHGVDAFIAGVFRGDLDHGGEQILLKSASGTVILDFSYNDAAPWPSAADGDGYAMVFGGAAMGPPGAGAAGSLPAQWHSSASLGGTPGAEESPANYAAWKTLHGITDGAADEDHDGRSNFLEYAMGTDPNVVTDSGIAPSAVVYTLPVGQDSGTYFTVSVRRNLAADDVSWTMETSASLAAEVWSTTELVLVGELNNHDGTATMVFRSAVPLNVAPGTAVFARARAVLR
jgi:hypothetical protein